MIKLKTSHTIYSALPIELLWLLNSSCNILIYFSFSQFHTEKHWNNGFMLYHVIPPKASVYVEHLYQMDMEWHKMMFYQKNVVILVICDFSNTFLTMLRGILWIAG